MMSNASADMTDTGNIVHTIDPATLKLLNDLESERSSLDSHHDNHFSRKHTIILELYNGRQTYSKEDDFVNDINNDESIPNEYFVERDLRKGSRVSGFFTPKMEILVNDTPFHFPNIDDNLLTFVYDQGPHPINYFKGANNGVFVSDAVDTASKKTGRSQHPKLFQIPNTPSDSPYINFYQGEGEPRRITILGSYIGFNENIVRSVVFSELKQVSDQVECKIVIEANVNLPPNKPNFKWYDLSQKFDVTNTSLIGYSSISTALQNANFKQSNDKNTGFFIGNTNSIKILETRVEPIIALCLVVAKVLGDFSSALAASPTLVTKYVNPQDVPTGLKFIHASGDRLCSLEATRQGANVIQTYPRNSSGVIPFQYTPGTLGEIKIDHEKEFERIHEEILERFTKLLIDVRAFSIYKYRVDGKVIEVKTPNTREIDKEPALREFVNKISEQIETAQTVVNNYIQSIPGEAKVRYEILNRQKLVLMPQSPLISTQNKDESRKNLNVEFHLYKLPDGSSGKLLLRDGVYQIMKKKNGGKRKRRTLRRSRGGMDGIQTPQKGTPQNSQSDASDMSDTQDYEQFPQVIPPQKVPQVIPPQDSQLDMSDETNHDEVLQVVPQVIPPQKGPKVIPEVLQVKTSQKVQPYSLERKALSIFNNILYNVRDKVFEFALSKGDIPLELNPLSDLIISKYQIIKNKFQSFDNFVYYVKRNVSGVYGEIVNYDEEFMQELEEIFEQEMDKQQENIEDNNLITMFKTMKAVDAPVVGGNRKRKTFRRKRLF
jgi:hypothetical protein